MSDFILRITHEELGVRHDATKRLVVELPGFVNDHRVSALPDTGAARNMISLRFARKHGIPIQRGLEHRHSFQIANGRTVRSKGIARAAWTFSEDPGTTYDLEFHILASCPYDILIGAKFLEETETLSVHRDRLKERQVSSRGVHSVNLCGSPSQSLRGYLNTEPVSVLPDTGSQANLMSERYARDHGLIIDTKDDSRKLLQLADGTTQKTLGKVAAMWAFDDDPEKLMNLIFDILPTCAYDVILGLDILYQHNAYAIHSSSMIEVEAEDQSKLLLNLVGWLPPFWNLTKRRKKTGQQLILTDPLLHENFFSASFLRNLHRYSLGRRSNREPPNQR